MIVLLCLLTTALVYSLRFFTRQSSLVAEDWVALLQSLHPLSPSAQSLLKACENGPLHYRPKTMWQMIGGLHGLLLLHRNVCVMLELAAYAEGWTGEIGIIMSELMRRDAIHLRRAMGNLMLSYVLCGGSEARVTAFKAVLQAYKTTRSRIQTLYETTHGGLAPELVASLNLAG